MYDRLPLPTLKRLPKYYNILNHFIDRNEDYVKSSDIAQILGGDETQVRKDIAATGYTGKPKVGFNTRELKAHLAEFLGFNNTKDAFLVGAGNLGIALAKYDGFSKYGLNIAALFDTDPHKIGLKVGNKEVFPLSKLPNLIHRMNIKIIILAVPVSFAQEIANQAIESGIRAIWNFSPINLEVPPGIIVSNQDLASDFVVLSVQLDKILHSEQ